MYILDKLYRGTLSPIEDFPKDNEAYVEALDDDSVAPKQKLREIAQRMREEQRKIALIQAQAQITQQRVQQFLMEDPDGQAQQIADAQLQMLMEQEAGLDEQTADAEAALPVDEMEEV